MNQLTHTTHTTQQPHNALATIMQSPRAIDASPQQLAHVLAQAMAKAFADMGLKIDDRADDVTYLVQNMPAQVTTTLPAIRLNEIPIAINRGIMQQFGPFYGLNIATFMRFLTAHYQSEQRLEALRMHLATVAGQINAVQPSAQQQQQNRLNRIATAFAQYKNEGHYNDYGNLVFDTINKLGKIPFSLEREAQIVEQARQNMINRYSRMSLYPDERAQLRATLNQIMNGEAPNLIITEAKRITLFELFDNLIAQGIEVMDWLGEA